MRRGDREMEEGREDEEVRGRRRDGKGKEGNPAVCAQ